MGCAIEKLKLSLESIKDRKSWESQGFELPKYDIKEVRQKTLENPQWIHFGSGNIFRAFPARIHDELLDEGLEDRGVILAETRNVDKLDYIFGQYDYLTTAVTLKAEGSVDARVIGSIAGGLKIVPDHEDWDRAKEIFKDESLRMITFTITEKGYNIRQADGSFQPAVQEEMDKTDLKSTNTMGIVCLMLFERYQAGEYPLTLVSMDNVSHNGQRMKESILDYAKAWVENGSMDEGFLDYLEDESKLAFPISMIDKITPAADDSVGEILKSRGYVDIEKPVMDGRVLPPSYANAEETEYLVIEDKFTNGRPNWDKKGVIFTDAETVDQAETMKVATCLNPLHTSLAVYGCLLGYEKINEEMEDEDLVNLINGVGYKEGLPVVVDPGILDPVEFLDTVVEVRLPNPFLPDKPQRIATDTSQKLSVRFGKTISEYMKQDPGKLDELVYIPAVLAGWLRYLMGLDDKGIEMEISPDPLLDELKVHMDKIEFEETENLEERLEAILRNEDIFGVDLYEAGLADKIVDNFSKLNSKPGAIREFLEELPRYTPKGDR